MRTTTPGPKRKPRGPSRVISSGRVKLVPDAAAHLGVAKSTLDKMRTAGDGPVFMRIGARKVGYLVDDLDAWLESRRRTSTSAP